jgi:hypothetical protein
VNDGRLSAAAHNNAAWCEAVCAAHGCPGTWLDAGWLNAGETPRFYPNLVTLGGPMERDAHLALVERLLQSAPGHEVSAKDSFGSLDLAPLGFTPLFEAEWLWLEPGSTTTSVIAADAATWSRVETAAGLEEWEAAWAAAQGTSPPPTFPPTLLIGDIVFLAAASARRPVGGAIANRSEHTGIAVAGLSNVFAPPHWGIKERAALVAGAAAAFPGLPLAGYESGDDLAMARRLGFESIGPLRVWQRPAR